MPVSESMVQEIVQQVMAKMQIADAPAEKQHGVFRKSYIKCPWTREKKLLAASAKKLKKMQKLWHVWV